MINPKIGERQQGPQRARKADFKEFKEAFQSSLRTYNIIPRTSHDIEYSNEYLCKACDSIKSKKIKTDVYNNTANILQMTSLQVQKHFQNSFRRCMYRDTLTNRAKLVIEQFVQQYLREHKPKSLLTKLKQYLKLMKYDIFPPQIDAYASKIKKKLEPVPNKEKNSFTTLCTPTQSTNFNQGDQIKKINPINIQQEPNQVQEFGDWSMLQFIDDISLL